MYISRPTLRPKGAQTPSKLHISVGWGVSVRPSGVGLGNWPRGSQCARGANVLGGANVWGG